MICISRDFDMRIIRKEGRRDMVGGIPAGEITE